MSADKPSWQLSNTELRQYTLLASAGIARRRVSHRGLVASAVHYDVTIDVLRVCTASTFYMDVEANLYGSPWFFIRKRKLTSSIIYSHQAEIQCQ